ncbi:MAG: hypothetical protein JWQ88_3701 [Rhodoferax sp.]|nr:hypothetical protein [Rhodoferax sp.]
MTTEADFQPGTPANADRSASAAATPFPFPTADNHGTPGSVPQTPPEAPSEGSIDHGVAESFPASDPVSVAVTKIDKPSDADDVSPPIEVSAGGEDLANGGMPPIATPS